MSRDSSELESPPDVAVEPTPTSSETRASGAEWAGRVIDYVLIPGFFLTVLALYLRSTPRPQTPLETIEYALNVARYSLVPVLLWASRRPSVVRLNVRAVVGLVLAFSAPFLWEIELLPGAWYTRSSEVGGLRIPNAAVMSVVVLLYTGMMLVSYLNLGRSVSTIPALKSVVTRGLYRVVRHPIYATAVHLAGASLVALPTVVNAACFAALNVGMWLRASEEEKVLSLDPGYRSYRERVKTRFYTPVVSAPLLILFAWRLFS